MIPRTLLVSFPRSGTHLTIDILQAYFGSHALKWVDAHQDPVQPKHNLIKTHDFDLDVTKETYGCEHVIVLWRERLWAVESFIRSGMALPWCGGGESARGEIEAFWDRWMEKWSGHDVRVCYGPAHHDYVWTLYAAAFSLDNTIVDAAANRFHRIANAIDRRTA